MNKKLYKKLGDKKVFLFDFDGTLMDSEKYHKKAHSKVLSIILNKEFKMTDKIFSKYVGNTDDVIFDMYKKDFNIDFDKEKMITLKVSISKKFLMNKKAKIFKYFYKLRKKLPEKEFYIVTNQQKEFLVDILNEKHILNNFKELFCMSDLNVKKEFFLKNINKELKTNFNQCVLFEDVDKYLNCAKKLGMLTVGVETKRNRKSLINADYIIKC